MNFKDITKHTRKSALHLATGLMLLLSNSAIADTSSVQEKTTSPTTNYQEQGRKLVKRTAKALGGELMTAMAQGGPTKAVKVCNIKALPVTAQVAQLTNSRIKRVTDKPRNPLNTATDNELDIINSMKQQLTAGTQPTPLVQENQHTVTGYYPIITQQICLSCHGVEGTQINHSTLRVIQELYPNDLATGYGANQLRGLFVVEMKKDHAETVN